MTELSSKIETQDRFIWLDSLRLAAGVSMVGLHATADSLGQPFTQFNVGQRIAPMLLRAVIYTARTELFLMISVFLLLLALEKRPKTYKETMGIQARRLLVPFAFWTLFYAFYNLIKGNAFGYADTIASDLLNPLKWIEYFSLGSVKYHMHFIPTLFGLLLLYPLFRLAQRFPILGALVLVCLLIKRELDQFVFAEFWGAESLPYVVRLVKISTYAGYGLMAGAFLGVWQQVSAGLREKFLPLLLFFGSLLFLVKLVATWKTIESGAWPFNYTAGYWADFLMPVVLFAVALCLGHKRWPQVFSWLAPYSFGIYLCHPIFLDLVEIWLNGRSFSPIEQVITKVVFGVAATSVLVMCLARFRPLAWTIGLGPLPRLPILRAAA